jgi:hypothetical protein
MRKRTNRPTRRDKVQRIALQRTLAYLAVIRPGVPLPLVFLENLVSGDLMLEGPHQLVVQNLAVAPTIINAGLEELYSLTIQDSGRAAITVTETQRAALQQRLQALGPDTSWVAALDLDDPEMSCVSELHIAAGLDLGDYAPDQRALLAAHGLFWLERALAKLDGGGAYGAIEIYDALWLLYDQEAVALSELTPLLPRVIDHCLRYGREWSDSSPLFYLASVAEALIESEEPELRPWAKQAFALVVDLAADYSGEERNGLTKLMRGVRQRTGL